MIRVATATDVPVVTHWLYAEWGHLYPAETQQTFYDHAMRWVENETEALLVAENETGMLTGCISITVDDVPERPFLGPWLSNLFVVPHARATKLAMSLLENGLNAAKTMNVQDLYCVALKPTHCKQYKRYGFKECEALEWHGAKATILKHVH